MSLKFNVFTGNFDDVGAANAITALTGDVTAAGPGSVAATIANGAVTDAKVATGIDAAKIADGSVSNTEFQYIGTLTSDAQTQISSKVTGPSSSTDNAITRFDSTTGKLVQNSLATIDDSGNLTANNISGTNTGDQTIALSSDVSGTGTGAITTTVNSVGGKTSSAVATSVNDTIAATSSNTNTTIVKRDGSGNFSAGTVTASLTGNVTGNLTGNVTGNVTGTATNSTNAATTATNSTNATFFPTFVASSSSGNQGIDTATGLTFNPSTNTLTTTTVVASVTGNVTGNVTGSASGNLAKATGDIDLTSFSGSNNQSSAANVTSFSFANASVRAFKAVVSAYVNATSTLYEEFTIDAVQRGADWQWGISSIGDNSQVVFTITTSGQVQYTSGNYSGFSSLAIRFRALVTSV